MNRRDALIDLAVRAAFMAVIYLVFALQLPNYHTSNGIAALLDGAVLIGIVSVGVGVTMIAGEFDLSVGSLAALTGVIALEIISIGVLPALVVGVLFAAAVGAIQGLSDRRSRDQFAGLHHRHADRSSRPGDGCRA